jgi:hypothetical protein
MKTGGHRRDFGPFFGEILSTGDPRRLEFGTRFDF